MILTIILAFLTVSNLLAMDGLTNALLQQKMSHHQYSKLVTLQAAQQESINVYHALQKGTQQCQISLQQPDYFNKMTRKDWLALTQCGHEVNGITLRYLIEPLFVADCDYVLHQDETKSFSDTENLSNAQYFRITVFALDTARHTQVLIQTTVATTAEHKRTCQGEVRYVHAGLLSWRQLI